MQQTRENIGDILRRIALPFLLFSTILLCFLLLSWYLVVPRLTNIEVGGSVLSAQELRTYEADLRAQIGTLEHQRRAFLLPSDNDAYGRLKSLKRGRLKYQHIRSEINTTISRLVPGRKDVVTLSSFSFNGSTNIVEIRGQVQNVGPRSMTVLAQFVEDIDRIEGVLEIDASKFVRKETADGNFYSPFTIRLLLR